MSELVRVCITYVTSDSRLGTAENCITTVITEDAYRQLTESTMTDAETRTLECLAGQCLFNMLLNLAHLQGYEALSWYGIEAIE